MLAPNLLDPQSTKLAALELGLEPDTGVAPTPLRPPMDDERFQAAVEALVTRARDYMETDVQPDVKRAWKYYDGEVDAARAQPTGVDARGEEQYEGSGIVITECRDTVRQMLPDLARVFLATDHAVEYVPTKAEDVAGAEQATDWANFVFDVENDGENLILDAQIDWLLKFCAAKVYWDDKTEKKTYRFSGLSEEALGILLAESQLPSSGVVEFEYEATPSYLPQLTESAPAAPPPMPPPGLPPGQGPDMPQASPGGPGLPGMVPPGPPGAPPDAAMAQGAPMMPPPAPPAPPPPAFPPSVPAQLYKGQIVREKKCGKIAIELIPQDEFLIDPDASSTDTALIVGQDCYRLVSDIVALGVDYETVRDHAGQDRKGESGARKIRGRTPATGNTEIDDDAIGYVRVVEASVRLDKDGDGIAERYRILALGEEPELVASSPDDDCGWIVSSPMRRPHQPIGDGVDVKDLQDLNTALMRGLLDNLGRANRPREIVGDDDPRTYEDVKRWYGGPIRARPDMIGVHVIPFVGAQTLPVMELVEQRRSMRTGLSQAGQGLDANALKGQTQESAERILSAPQSQMEYIVRQFGISFMRPIFKWMLKLSTRYQEPGKVIRLRNEWVPIDPRAWNDEMDARPRVGLGTGTRAERLIALNVIATKQEALIASGSPLVTLKEYRVTLIAIAELLGEKDGAKYFKEITDADLQAHAEQQANAQAAAVQAQMQGEIQKAQAKAQADMQVSQAKIAAEAQLEGQRMQIEGQREDAKLQAEMAMRREEMQAKWAFEARKLEVEREIKLQELSFEARLEAWKMKNQSPGGQGNIPATKN